MCVYQDWKIAEIEEEDYTTVELLIRMHIYTDLDTIFKTLWSISV